MYLAHGGNKADAEWGSQLFHGPQYTGVFALQTTPEAGGRHGPAPPFSDNLDGNRVAVCRPTSCLLTLCVVITAVPYEAMVPEHTQHAIFQLYCDLRANPIKDRHWFEVHARRLKPHTYAGWIVSALHLWLV